MSNMNMARYKRIVQYFWDPEPKNHQGLNCPIWCLGIKYGFEFNVSPAEPELSQGDHFKLGGETAKRQHRSITPDAGAEHFQTMVITNEPKVPEDLGWPEEFLDDFESRMLFTYRAHFPAIEEFRDTKLSNTTSLTVRLRSQLVNGGGFTSDTGWGCMIRSGQCLLGNALVMLHLGRGTKTDHRFDSSSI
jgi:cysteine protease ATG4